MNASAARRSFRQQKRDAARRGIGWELTFDQWLSWWGSDLAKRGCRHGQLQMQRIADAGPYALGNIRKGTARENNRTAALVRKTREGERAATEKFAAEMAAPTVKDEPVDEQMRVIRPSLPSSNWRF